MDAQWVLVICVIALLLGLYRMSRRIDQKIAQALEQKPTNQVIPAASKAELGDDSFWKWFQSSKVASIVVRRQVILSVNPAAEQLLGRSLSDLKDRPASAFMTQSSAAFAQKVGIEPELSELGPRAFFGRLYSGRSVPDDSLSKSQGQSNFSGSGPDVAPSDELDPSDRCDARSGADPCAVGCG